MGLVKPSRNNPIKNRSGHPGSTFKGPYLMTSLCFSLKHFLFPFSDLKILKAIHKLEYALLKEKKKTLI